MERARLIDGAAIRAHEFAFQPARRLEMGARRILLIAAFSLLMKIGFARPPGDRESSRAANLRLGMMPFLVAAVAT
jgi:hypothetical protein